MPPGEAQLILAPEVFCASRALISALHIKQKGDDRAHFGRMDHLPGLFARQPFGLLLSILFGGAAGALAFVFPLASFGVDSAAVFWSTNLQCLGNLMA